MAIPSSPMPVLRFAGLLAGTEEELAAARWELTQWYGDMDVESAVVPYGFTDDYTKEMGPGLLRQWVRFKNLFMPEHLPKCKLETNMAETLLAREFRDKGGRGVTRPINIDPGYLQRDKIVFATTKDDSHRVYLSEGVYGEVALHWVKDNWVKWPWTFADYQTETAVGFFKQARAAYLAELQRITAGK